MTLRAAVYVRISRDDGSALGVGRQEKDCRAWCEERGHRVVAVLVDNDVSAYSGRSRPGYEEMMTMVDDGEVDLVVAWHPDRLHRRPVELEDFISRVNDSGVEVSTVTAGDVDLSTPEGRLVARITGSVARKESEDKSRRIRRKHVELAEAGAVSGGGRRPFGYESDRVTVREVEAVEIRDAVERVLTGASLRSVVLDWQERVPSVTGALWQPTTLRRLLGAPRLAGLRVHRGRIVGEAVWPGIITVEDSARVRAVLSSRPATQPVRSRLLTGFVWCGRCGGRMSSMPVKRRGHRYHRYACPRDRGGCGRCGVSGDRLDELVVAYVLRRLADGHLAEDLARAEAVEPIDASEVRALESRGVELAEMYAAGEVGRVEWVAARSGIERRLAEARERLGVEIEQRQIRPTLVGGGDIAERWDGLGLEDRRALVGVVVGRIEIAPGSPQQNRFTPDRVSIMPA